MRVLEHIPRPAKLAAIAVLLSSRTVFAETCGVPVGGGATPVASDALFILGAAVGTQSCLTCICDVNDSGSVTAPDALLDLKLAVGQSVALDCPPCSETTTSTTTTTTTTTITTMAPVTTSTVPTTTLCSAQAPDVPALKIVAVNDDAAGFATFAAQPPGSSDWYLASQEGVIRIVRDGQLLPVPFLDLSAAMGSNFGERGLLGIAFHPDYAANGRFFTMATPSDNANGSYAPINSDAVVEWKRSEQNPDVASTSKVRDIVVLPGSDDNHNGGTIVFGPDKMLYVGTGDGGGGCESAKPGAVQDVSKLFGKILRLDIDGSAPFAAAGNPFASDARVFHYGLRNPFRFGFDSLTSDMFLGDVGQNSFEEISVAPAGAAGLNFGWPAFEGNTQGTCAGKQIGGPSPHTPPILAIDRRNGSDDPFADYESIVGGRVYRGSAIPSLHGVYLFADFTGTELGALRYCNGEVGGPVAIPLSQIPVSNGALQAITSFVEGNDGELYVTYGFSTRIGRIEAQ